MPKVYIETSIVSYLRQEPSSQVVTAARQLLTHRWWNDERRNYELVTSQYVLDEAALGDSRLANDRLQALKDIRLLSLDMEIDAIAKEIVFRAILPSSASLDALHIATAAHHRVEYPLTWNCTHIANARIMPRIRNVLSELGVSVPLICTPQEMVGDE